MATLAPSAARRLAIAAPMPREPPVTRAILPSSLFYIVIFLCGFSEEQARQAYRTILALAEWLCRTADRIDPA
jgi:hypothetical protein